MYFEDEKENVKNGGAFDDLEVDIDGDDKSVTWDDLLNDESDIDISNVKKGALADDDLLDVSDDDDMALLDDDITGGQVSANERAIHQAAAPKRKDAFDVFGGSGESVNNSEAAQQDTKGDAFTPDLTNNRQSARAKAGMNNDDDIYFEPSSARKSSSVLPTIIGIVVAFIFIAALGYVFMTYSKSNSIAKLDAQSLFNNNKNAQETPLIPNEADKPVIDINAPAEQNAANNADKNAESKKEEQKLVTFSVTNGGRINPFAPPAGFEATKFVVSSDYEILSPPEEIPGAEIADEAKNLMNITVSGILFDNVKPSAIINVNDSEYFVQIGDKVDDFQVVAINKQYVAIKDGTNIYKAQVGESFTPTGGGVAGMAKRQTSGKFAGSRQYTSPSDVEVSVKD